MPLLTALGSERWHERPGLPGGSLSLVPFTPTDIGLAESWLSMAHVAKWWLSGPGAEEERFQRARSALVSAMEEPEIAPFAIRLNGERIGYLALRQLDAGSRRAAFDLPACSLGIALLIGVQALLGKGYGRRAIGLAVEAGFSEPSVAAAFAAPHPRNLGAVGAFKAAGFRLLGASVTRTGPAQNLRLDRPAA